MKCRICGNSELTLLSESLRDGAGRVFHCADCDLGILDADPSMDLAAFYAEQYWKNHGPELGKDVGYENLFESYVNYQGNRLELLRPHLRPDVRLLEVGCATGQFLYNVKPLVGEAVGVDYDSGATAYAARRTGCRTFGGGLAKSGLEPASFDMVCAFQTMEHVPDPVAFVADLVKYLRPSGVLVLEVPNLYDPLIAAYDNAAYRKFFYHPAHLFYFSEKSLRRTAELGDVHGEIHFVQDYNFTNHMHWIDTQGPQSGCHAGLGVARLPLASRLASAERAALESWIAEVDQSYKALLRRLRLTENLTFIGKVRATS